MNAPASPSRKTNKQTNKHSSARTRTLLKEDGCPAADGLLRPDVPVSCWDPDICAGESVQRLRASSADVCAGMRRKRTPTRGLTSTCPGECVFRQKGRPGDRGGGGVSSVFSACSEKLEIKPQKSGLRVERRRTCHGRGETPRILPENAPIVLFCRHSSS